MVSLLDSAWQQGTIRAMAPGPFQVRSELGFMSSEVMIYMVAHTNGRHIHRTQVPAP